MPEKERYDFKVIFEKMAEITAKDQDDLITEKDIEEYEEIRVLRQIVMEVQSQPQIFFAST